MSALIAILVAAGLLYFVSEYARRAFFGYTIGATALEVRLFHSFVVQRIPFANIRTIEVVPLLRAVQVSLIPFRALVLTTRLLAPHVLIRKIRGVAVIITPMEARSFVERVREEMRRSPRP